VAVLSLVIGLIAVFQGGGLQVPKPVGLVDDFAHVLNTQTSGALTTLAQAVRTHSPGEMAIVTLPDLKGQSPSDVALQIGRDWKVGKFGQPGDPNRNAGVIILVVPKETNSSGKGECHIEVGRGAEGYITDGDAGDICREAVARYFRTGDYNDGTALVAMRVAQKFAQNYNFSLDSAITNTLPSGQPASAPQGSGGGIPPVFFLILLFVVLSLLGGNRRGCLPLFLLWGIGGGGGRGGFGGGGFGGGGGGGFGGFGGGGGFSGGGGGSSW
jgi:uncharacterized protein